MGVGLRHDAGQVGLHRSRRDEQLLGDLVVGQTASHQHENLALAVGKAAQRRSAPVGSFGAPPAAPGASGHEGLHEPAHHRGLDERVTGGHHADGGGDVVGVGVLQQKAARPCPQGVVDVLVDIEGGEHQHPGPGQQRVGRDGAAGLDAAHLRHANIHEHYIGPEALGLFHSLGAVSGLADDLDALVGGEDHLESRAHEVLVVHNEHANGLGLSHGSPPSKREERPRRCGSRPKDSR